MHVLLWSLALLLTTSSISSPANADDRTDCFAIGRTDYDNAALFDTRIKACTRYISRAQGKHRAEGYSSRGSWYTKKGNYDQALADFDRALAIDAMNVEFYDYKADVLLAKGDVDGAIDNYNQSIRIDPTYAAAHYSRGRAYEKKGDLERARESYRAALVPPLKRKLAVQERIQSWAQQTARSRLKELDEASRK